MVRRASRPRGARAPGVGIVIAAAVLAATIAQPISRAQTASELDRARDLYAAAEAAVKDGRVDDAARDYGAAYELSKDPALFFKIGRAQERAGRCEVALTYYARYLREGQPAEPFVAATRERIVACGGNPDAGGPAPGQTGSAGATTGSGAATGSAAAGSNRAATGSGGAAPGTASPATEGSAATTDDRSAAGGTAAGRIVASATPADAGAGSASVSAGSRIGIPSARHKVAWVLTGSAVALASLGGILAYATNSAENDIRDLYVGIGGLPPSFDARTRETYDELVAQGRRYQRLSWTAFGVAGAAALGAAILFITGDRSTTAEQPRITPVVTPRGAGMAWTF